MLPDSVTVTVVRDGRAYTFTLAEVQDFNIEVKRKPKPKVFSSRPIFKDDEIESISFFMRPIVVHAGRYMTVEVNKEPGWVG